MTAHLLASMRVVKKSRRALFVKQPGAPPLVGAAALPKFLWYNF
jgi:hypothetical protein